MAAQRLKTGTRSGMLLDGTASSLLHHYCKTTSLLYPPTLPSRALPSTRSRVPSLTTTPYQLTTEQKKRNISACFKRGSKYIVNPSRYPHEVLQARFLPHKVPARNKTDPQSSNSSRVRNLVGRDYALSSLRECYDCFPMLPRVESSASPLAWRGTPSPPSPLTPLSLLNLHLYLEASATKDTDPLLDAVSTFSPSLSPSTPHPPPPPLCDKPTPSQLAFILLKLREELPAFFEGHHTMGLYADDMTFENSLGSTSWTVQGSAAYAVLLTTWRVMVKVCFSHSQLDLIKISKDLDSGKIAARWRVRGKLRAPWSTRERIILEAFSTFSVNSDGHISSHKVDKAMPGGKEPNRVMSWLARVGMALAPSPQHSVEATRTNTLLLT